MTEKLKPREKPHYVNNRQFSYAVVDYVTEANEAKVKGEKNPVVTDYIATCFKDIGEIDSRDNCCSLILPKDSIFTEASSLKWIGSKIYESHEGTIKIKSRLLDEVINQLNLPYTVGQFGK